MGKYERVSAEKYDDFLKALDVNMLLRKAATVSTPVMEVAKEGDLWTIKTSTSLKSMELKFEVMLFSDTFLALCLSGLGVFLCSFLRSERSSRRLPLTVVR